MVTLELSQSKNLLNIQGLINKPSQKRWLFLNVLSSIVGVISSIIAILFKYALIASTEFFFDVLLPRISFFVWGYNLGYIILPILGAIIVSPILTIWAKNVKGGGVGATMEAFVYNRAQVKRRVLFLKFLGSTITIGSGGSGGPEGPIIQMSGALGSMIGNLFHLTPNEKRILIASAVGAGIAAIFNAPLGGAVFTIELLVPSFEFFVTIPIIVASVIGGLIGRWFSNPEFSFVDISLPYSFTPIEVTLFAVLGLLCGLLAYIWVRFFIFIQKRFNENKKRTVFQPMIGAICTGIIIMFMPEYGIQGTGADGVKFALTNQMGFCLLLTLALIKLFTTTMTVSSGGSAGIFAPSLYVGFMFGGAMGNLYMILFPGEIQDIMIFYILGFGAFFAAASQEPIGILIITTEMVGNVLIILPLMMTITIAFTIMWLLLKGIMVYTIPQELKGKPIRTDTISLLLTSTTSAHCVQGLITYSPDMTIDVASEINKKQKLPLIPVVQSECIMGVIYPSDFEIIEKNYWHNETIQKIMHTDYISVISCTKILDALDVIDEKQVQGLILVHSEKSQKFYGLFLKDKFIQESTEFFHPFSIN